MGISTHVRSNYDYSASDVEMQQFSVDYELHCHICKTDIGHLLSTGQAGCPQCYSVFRKEIERFFMIKKSSNNDVFPFSDPMRDRFNEFIEH